MKWNDNYIRDLQKQLAGNLEQAAQHLEAKIKERLEANKETGELQDSIKHVTEGDTAYVGSDCPYAMAVEAGTSKAQARPFLRSTLNEQAEALAKIIVGGKS